MVYYMFVIQDLSIRAAVIAACRRDPTLAGSWECGSVCSFEEAAHVASKRYSSIVLFEYRAVTTELRADLLGFRKRAPGAPICAILNTRKFDSEEIAALLAMGVGRCIDVDTLASPERLVRMLDGVAAMLVSAIAMALLRKRIGDEELAAAKVCMRTANPRSEAGLRGEVRHVLLPSIRALLPPHRAAEAETFCLAVQLLTMALLMMITQSPASHFFLAAGFTSADAARKAFKDLTGLTVTEAGKSDAALQRSIQILLDVIAGVRPRLRAAHARGGKDGAETRRHGDTETRTVNLRIRIPLPLDQHMSTSRLRRRASSGLVSSVAQLAGAPNFTKGARICIFC